MYLRFSWYSWRNIWDCPGISNSKWIETWVVSLVICTDDIRWPSLALIFNVPKKNLTLWWFPEKIKETLFQLRLLHFASLKNHAPDGLFCFTNWAWLNCSSWSKVQQLRSSFAWIFASWPSWVPFCWLWCCHCISSSIPKSFWARLRNLEFSLSKDFCLIDCSKDIERRMLFESHGRLTKV